MRKKAFMRRVALLVSLLMLMTSTIQTTYGFLIVVTDPVINTFKPEDVLNADLVIAKEVVHADGDGFMVPTDAVFTFDVALSEKYRNSGVTVIGGENPGRFVADENGIIHGIQLKAGQMAGIRGIDEGTEVTVTEDLSGLVGYTVRGGSASKTLTVSSNPDDNIVTFVNVYDPGTVPSVQIPVTVTKVMSYEPGAGTFDPEGRFEFVLQEASGGQSVLLVDENSQAVFHLSYTEADIGKTFIYTLSETDNGIPDVEYDVEYASVAGAERLSRKFEVQVLAPPIGGQAPTVLIDGQPAAAYGATFVNKYSGSSDVGPVVPEGSVIVTVTKKVNNVGTVSGPLGGYRFLLEDISGLNDSQQNLTLVDGPTDEKGNAPEAPGESPAAPETPSTPDTPTTPANPETPGEAPGTPEIPTAPESPVIPETPTIPANPEIPGEVPGTPETPAVSDTPEEPAVLGWNDEVQTLSPDDAPDQNSDNTPTQNPDDTPNSEQNPATNPDGTPTQNPDGTPNSEQAPAPSENPGEDILPGAMFTREADFREIQTSSGAGKARFELKFTKDDVGQTYTYKLTEINDGAAYTTYDTAEYTFTVTIREEEGKLVTAVNGEDGARYGAVFTNTYNYTPASDPVIPTVPEPPKMEVVSLTAVKEIVQTGDKALTPAGFVFELNNLTTGQKVIRESDQSGNANFQLTFAAADIGKTYSYALYESSPEGAKGSVDGIGGMSQGVLYDSAVHPIQIEVVKGKKGAPMAKVTIDGQSVKNLYNMVKFTNVELSGVKDVVLTVKAHKTIKNTGDIKLGPEEFKIVLKRVDSDGKRIGKTLSERTSRKGNASFELPAYSVDDLGEIFRYQVYEKNEGKDGVTYDETVHEFQVQLSLSEDYKLKIHVLLPLSVAEHYAKDTENEALAEAIRQVKKSSAEAESAEDADQWIDVTEYGWKAEFTNSFHGEKGDVPKTGDNSNMDFWFTMMILSLISTIALLVAERRSCRRYKPKHY